MAANTLKGQVKTPFGRLTSGIMFGYACMFVGLMTPATLLLTFKMMEIDPNGFTTSYGLVAGVGAFFALIGNPIGGAVSDRTNIAFGRRRTWILLGPLFGCAALLWIGMASAVWQVLVGWCVAQLFFNFGMAAYTALIPDQVPEEKRGTISGLMGLALPIGIAVGMVLMMSMPNAASLTKWLLVSIIGFVGPVISLFIIREGKIEIPSVKKEKVSVKEKMGKVYPSPRKYPEFTWALVSKFLLMLGYCSNLYLTVMFVDRLGLTQAEATQSVGTISIVGLAATAIASILGGMLSDKVKKQKPFLYGCSVIILIGLFILAFVPTLTAVMIAGVILGIGLGAFSSVDMALVTRILPNKEDAAKDFGLMNVANALPQSIVPAIAPLLLGIGGWVFFFLSLSVCVVLAMFALRPLPEVGEYKDEIITVLPEAK
ncbi:MFS transporter [Neobacillus niacini]|uniref:MFS transporter n=1 Tax=Neobacillus niacini TaxID=86668 RepID=UPI003000F338